MKFFLFFCHNSKIKDEVTQFLRDLGLVPIILQEEPNLGKTIIEKVEHYVSLTSFAIVILTKDDFGISKIDFNVEEKISRRLLTIDANSLEYRVRAGYCDEIQDEDVIPFFELTNEIQEMSKKIRPRARQNVIFELGITMGILHRNNVRVIYEEGVELPSDILGYAYTALNEKWKENILEELKAMKFFLS